MGESLPTVLDLAAGVFASYGLDETQVMGAVGFIWRPNDQWIVQATPPVVVVATTEATATASRTTG